MSPFKHLPFLPFLLGRLLLSLLISSCSGIRNSPFSKRDILGAQRVLTLNFTKDEIDGMGICGFRFRHCNRVGSICHWDGNLGIYCIPFYAMWDYGSTSHLWKGKPSRGRDPFLDTGKDEKGRPTSMTLIGKLFDEATLLEVAHQFQQRTSFDNEWPEWLK